MLGTLCSFTARMPPPLYRTTDFHLAGFLKSQGVALEGCTRVGPKRVEFRFIADRRLHELLRLYWSGQPILLVPGRLTEALRTLKSRNFIGFWPPVSLPPLLLMFPSLTALRQAPQPTPAKFLASQPGCWIQYYDDTAQDPSKALSTRTFDVEQARRKQQEGCAVTFSLQTFRESRTKDNLECFRNLGVDVDLLSPAERGGLSAEEIDRRKEEYLSRWLGGFLLPPHWLIETRHGFHVIFRVRPQRSPEGIREALALNLRLVRALRGDEKAALPTQVLRVPGTHQLKDPRYPFLCRLLSDNGAVWPYELETVRGVLDSWEAAWGLTPTAGAEQPARRAEQSGWRAGLQGVPEGQRNATAASVIGGILARVPEELWETAGWGGLKEWNQRNPVPLPERELRAVFESIARRERARKRPRRGPIPDDVKPHPPTSPPPHAEH